MKLLKFSFLSLFLNGCIFSVCSAGKVASPQLLNSVINKYRQAAVVQMDVVKTLKSELLDKKTESEGKIFLSKEKFRFDIDKPEKSQVVFDGQTIWTIQFPAAELPGPVQVAKAKLGKNTQKQILISTLFSPGGIKKNFKIVDFKDEKDFENYGFESLTKELSLKDLKIKISKQKKVIEEMKYKDDVGNETIFVFVKTDFKNQSSPRLFNYQPPKGAQVTDL